MRVPRLLSCIITLAASCATLCAQIPTDDPDHILGGRVAIELRKPLPGGWTAYGQTGLRTYGRMLGYVRSDVTAGASYKLSKHFKTALSYTWISRLEYRSDFSSRHRLDADITGTKKAGDWRFSARERLEMTHRPGDVNVWQKPRNGLDLKSRIKVEYKINKHWRPYAGAELKHCLNTPTLAKYGYDKLYYRYITPSGDTVGEPGWMIDGHHVSLARVRGFAGVEIRRTKHSAIKLYCMLDYNDTLEIDTNHSGTVLKSLVYVSGYRTWGGLTYIRTL